MNTVFKFYYQAWVMLGIASAYGLWWVLNPGRKVFGSVLRNLFLVVSAALVAAGMLYPVFATMSRTNSFRSQPDLNGAATMARAHPDDFAAIGWLKEKLKDEQEFNGTSESSSYPPVILEAPGSSYTYEGRISAFSGYPAVLGWAIHELQWRGNYDEQGLREPDITTIYTTTETKLALDLLHKWDVRYVIVGQPEVSFIQQKCAQADSPCTPARAIHKFEVALTPVFQSGDVTIYEVPGKITDQAVPE